MTYKNEEELEMWYTAEKERLSDEFMNNINKDRENTPKFKARFDTQMKKLIAQYNSEYYKLMEYLKKHPKKE